MMPIPGMLVVVDLVQFLRAPAGATPRWIVFSLVALATGLLHAHGVVGLRRRTSRTEESS
ncbi:MAG: hypothetical protein KKI08_00475 [Armatimonadetes bacterium]|nr:hypothetical protein [Armatimonadota bacterium]